MSNDNENLMEGELIENPKKRSDNLGEFVKKGGPGRPKGSKTQLTLDFRESVNAILYVNAPKFNDWLLQVAEGDKKLGIKADPARALDLVVKLAEYVAPKQARTVIAGDKDAPVQIEFKWEDAE